MAVKTFFPSTPEIRLSEAHRAVLAASGGAAHGVYLGQIEGGWLFAGAQQSVMVLGPPRSGKTTSVIVPNVLASNGAVLSTSTKPDVLDASLAARTALGRCWLFDPTGSVAHRRGLHPLRWSPLQACTTWTGSLSQARTLVEVGWAAGSRRAGAADHSHWHERAQALLAPLLHAGSLGGADMRTVLAWVDRRQALPAQQILAGEAGRTTELARNLLDGIVQTDERELSGIWSTASGALSGFRSDPALDATSDPDFDAARFVRSSDTIYICAPAHLQAGVAPMVVGLIEDLRHATYARSAESPGGRVPGPPVLLALDELANIAPIPELPSMISEGGGQGLITVACLQDLSQARHRWPDQADGFPSLFGTSVVLPGIGDVRTLEGLSTLAGDEELPARSVSWGRAATDHPVTDLLGGGRPQHGGSVSSQWRRRLPADLIARGLPQHGLAFDQRNEARWVRLSPSHLTEPWRTLRGLDRALERRAGRDSAGERSAPGWER